MDEKKLSESELNKLRKLSGYKAAKFIKNNSIVGLGTGRNAKCFIDALAERIHKKDLENIIGIPTSKESEEYASENRICLENLNEILNDEEKNEAKKTKAPINIDVDGADQVADDFSLIKGYGGALTREKVIAKASEKFIVVVDETKISKSKYLNKKIPIEVIPFAVNYVKKVLKEKYKATCEVMKKKKGREKFITNNKNIILLANFGEILNPKKLEDELNLISGVVENGIFANRRADIVIVGTKQGVKILQKQK